MKKSFKKIISIVLALTMTAALLTAAITANAAGEEPDAVGSVRVIVKNEKYAKADGAAWDGTVIDRWASIYESSNILTVIKNTLDANEISYRINDWGYLAAIDGLEEYACNGSGGWMIALNDWFTPEGASAYSVKKNTLQNGDTISVMYSCNWGADLGSLWGNTDTRLSGINISSAQLDKEFDSDVNEYNLVINNSEEELITITPEAINKNYQVRTYLNEYEPEKDGAEYKLTDSINVKPGDTLYIGVGNESWPSMNEKAEETVYTFNVVSVIGDVDLNGNVNIDDATLVQKYIAELETLSELQLKAADADQNNKLNIDDVTAIQKIVAGMSVETIG